MKWQCNPIKKNEIFELFEKEDAICKIKCKNVIDNKLQDHVGTGFFLELNCKDIPFNKCLLTNNHILNMNDIQKDRKINFEYKNEKRVIEMTEKRRAFTNQELDYTCVEIFKKDNIGNYFQIEPYILENESNKFIENDIFILQYPLGKDLSFANGKILSKKII